MRNKKEFKIFNIRYTLKDDEETFLCLNRILKMSFIFENFIYV